MKVCRSYENSSRRPTGRRRSFTNGAAQRRAPRRQRGSRWASIRSDPSPKGEVLAQRADHCTYRTSPLWDVRAHIAGALRRAARAQMCRSGAGASLRWDGVMCALSKLRSAVLAQPACQTRWSGAESPCPVVRVRRHDSMSSWNKASSSDGAATPIASRSATNCLASASRRWASGSRPAWPVT